MSIYLDHAATTPMVEPCARAMFSRMQMLGNPSSLHSYGRETRKALEKARESMASRVRCHPSEIIFTGSGTESDNTALKGLFWRARAQGRNVIVVSAIEHHAVLDPAHWLVEHEGAELILLPSTSAGTVDVDFLRDLASRRGDEIAVISVMSANNETGVLQPLGEIVDIAEGYGISVHSDAVQSFGKANLSFSDSGLTALTLSAHKIGGPLGIGALILRKGQDIPALLHGGGQERDIRSGTFNAPAIVGFAAATEDAFENWDTRNLHVSDLRNKLESGILTNLPDAFINGVEAPRLPGISNITFPGTESDTLLLLLDSEGIACSMGSACTAGVQRPSHVLLAMGHSDMSARSSLRFSIGPSNTAAEIDHVVNVLPSVISRGRAANLR